MNDEGFDLPVTYKGQELEYPAKLIRFGYSYKIEVDINGTAVAFEPDEERNWRALVDPDLIGSNRKVSNELLQAIVVSIEAVTK
jgi:hypothetical protein